MSKQVDVPIKRGDIKRFRELMNETYRDAPKHQHFRYQQLTRGYGDYLYSQDNEKFMFELQEWKNKGEKL